MLSAQILFVQSCPLCPPPMADTNLISSKHPLNAPKTIGCATFGNSQLLLMGIAMVTYTCSSWTSCVNPEILIDLVIALGCLVSFPPWDQVSEIRDASIKSKQPINTWLVYRRASLHPAASSLLN